MHARLYVAVAQYDHLLPKAALRVGPGEEHSRVKTDPRDATRLCQRLSRSLEGNTRELALIRLPSEEEEQATLHRG